MVHAGDRPAAIDRLRRALDETEIARHPDDPAVPPVRGPAARLPRPATLSTGWVGERWDGPAEFARAARRRHAGRRPRRPRQRGRRPRSRPTAASRAGRPGRRRPLAPLRRAAATDRWPTDRWRPMAPRGSTRPDPVPAATGQTPASRRHGRRRAPSGSRWRRLGAPRTGAAASIEPRVGPVGPAPHVVEPASSAAVAPRAPRLADRAGPRGMAVVDGGPVAYLSSSGLDGEPRPPSTRPVDAGYRRPSDPAILLLPPEPTGGMPAAGVVRREVVVDGWRFEVEVESERRASLRERARRGARGDRPTAARPRSVPSSRDGSCRSRSSPGDPVVAGQQLLVVEAMKMQNELRAPRDGVISRVAVGRRPDDRGRRPPAGPR